MIPEDKNQAWGAPDSISLVIKWLQSKGIDMVAYIGHTCECFLPHAEFGMIVSLL